MEQVVIESIFKVDKAVKAQKELSKGFTDSGNASSKAQKTISIFANNLKKQSQSMTKVFSKGKLGFAVEAVKLAGKASKEAISMSLVPAKKAIGVVGKLTNSVLGVMKKAAIGIGIVAGVAYGAIAAASKSIPAIGQAMESMGETITRNLFMPLAQELLPIIMSIFQWVSKNRLVFVQLGTTFVQAFRIIKMAAGAVLNLFKKFYGAFQKAIGGGQITMQKFLGYVQLFSLKIAFIIAYLELKLEGVMEFLGSLFGTIWINSISPFLEGIKDGLLGSDGIFTLFNEFGNALSAIGDIFKMLGLTSGKENKTIQKGFKETGKFITELILFPIRAIVQSVTLIAEGIKYVIEKGSEFTRWVSDLWHKFDRVTSSMKEFKKFVKDIVDEIKKFKFDIFGSTFSVGDIASKLADEVTNGLNSAWDALKNTKVGKIFSLLVDKFGSSGNEGGNIEGMRASGGDVQAGKSYIVGEKGAEIFKPNQSGTIIPNNKIQTLGSAINGSSSGQYVDSRQFNFTVNGGNAEEIANKVKQLLNTKPDFKSGLRESFARFQ